MSVLKARELAPGYSSEVDSIDEQAWCQTLQEFDDANIYQSWSYAAVTTGRRNMSHLILRNNGDIVAIAQARIARLPVIHAGIAYVRWGPLWRRDGIKDTGNTFRQAIRALRNEFVCKRGLSLRLFPLLFDNDSSCSSTILTEEGFSSRGSETRSRTLLMDLSPPLEDLRAGMRRNWKRNLKAAEEGGLEIDEGSEDELFESFIEIYKEMVARKQFMEPNDIHQFRSIQAQLPEKLKMRIMLCRSREGVCAGVVWSALGKTGIELFAATSNVGIATRGSYLLRWKLIEKLKQSRFAVYDLNGINPIRNPGGYKFKSELAGKNGKDVYFLGRFDSHAGVLSHACVEYGERLRAVYRTVGGLTKVARGVRLWPKATNSGPACCGFGGGVRGPQSYTPVHATTRDGLAVDRGEAP